MNATSKPFNVRFPVYIYKEGLVPSMQVQKWAKDVLDIPQRTFQWWVRMGFLPRPTIKRGRFRYYEAARMQKEIVSKLEPRIRWTVKEV